MSVRSNAKAMVGKIRAASIRVDKRLHDSLVKTTVDTKEQIQRDWPNPLNSGPQASGRPSQSTGKSSKAWRRRVTRLSASIWNNVDYSQYCHFAFLDTADAAKFARAVFTKRFAAWGPRIAKELTAELNRIS